MLLLIGFAFHLLFMASVFDCYFTNPVVHGMQRFKLDFAESKRLVLIVGDGLRADLLFQQKNVFPDGPETVAPYLRSIVKTRGAFGVSHVRVPTESRAGHVAAIAGMYDDPIPRHVFLMKGWKSSSVDFDSVFNQSSTTFAFGSPDIVSIFSEAATPGKVLTWSYSEEDQDFTKNGTVLDMWAVDHLERLFRDATANSTLESQLRSAGTIFFMHLLGLDTTGHSYTPYSLEYMNNIQVNFFRDEETSYIFTADHGMSKIGNHGDGHPDNTRAPLIAWGRGIRGPLPDSSPSSHDDYSAPWELDHLLRRDIEQADLAPLMAAILGLNWPIHSVGVIPARYIFPRGGDETVARTAQVNAKVILEQYRIRHEIKKASSVFYEPFAPLEAGGSRISTGFHAIEVAISEKRWLAAQRLSSSLIQDGLAGLKYLQRYDALFIRFLATAAYVGWSIYAFLSAFSVLLPGPQGQTEPRPKNTQLAVLVLVGFWSVFAVQRSPWRYYFYVGFPVYFYAALVIGTIQIMVIAYTHRWIWSLALIFIGILWPWPTRAPRRRLSIPLRFLWTSSCAVTAIFLLLRVDKTENLGAILAGGVCMIGVATLAGVWTGGAPRRMISLFVLQVGNQHHSSRNVPTSQIALIVFAMAITSNSVYHLRMKTGLPIQNQRAGWIILTTATLIPLFSRSCHRHANVRAKLLMYFLAFGPCFVFLAISVEGLFYVAYCLTLVGWIEVERALGDGGDLIPSAMTTPKVSPDDLRIALFFLFFTQIGFFGTGKSFYVSPVYRLIPIFDSFSMALLLIYKILAPYFVLSVTFAALNENMGYPPRRLLLVVLALMDGITLTFFLNVRDSGSWSAINQSTSSSCGIR
ncbi:Phosphatidylinositolglycan class N-domain-containing protein [Roridomyces roridus]|uniref:GPI ethanolamine phosphate transferase 1 n=1 Tax=Roridomyces roridus TaxID=1738132 RepID=A0AAD7BDY3_9AGAR|nr:Phosphatidylinositolglycan class N-domain-containing protein [Roridomyces roridus]